MNKKKGMIVSGYFNPIHKGHIEYLNNAKALSDELFVIVNNDHQRALKGSAWRNYLRFSVFTNYIF
jgi:cytidyltransferase-like protein